MKKLLLAALALILVLGLAVGAWAEPGAQTEVASEPEATPDVNADADDVDDWLFEDDEWLDDEAEFGFDEDIFSDIDDSGEMLDVEDEVEDTLLNAMEVYSWFVMQPLDVDLDKPDSTGLRYQVLDERFNTPELLKDYVSTYFSDELVTELFAMNVYTEEGGFLYASTDGRNIDETILETEFEVASETADQVTYVAVVHYWNGEEDSEEEFRYVRQLIDGEWKFVEFPFFW